MDRRIRASLVSIATDIGLTTLKMGLGALTGSLALRADALHSASDLAVSGVVLLTLTLRRRGERAESAGTPTRWSRAVRWLEPTIALAVAGLILTLAVGAFLELSAGSTATVPPNLLWLALLGCGVAATASYFVSRFKIIVGREEDSPALVADGYHSRMDMFSTIGVMIAIVADAAGVPLEGLAAVVISGLVAFTGIELLASAIRSFARAGGVDTAFVTNAVAAGLERLRSRVGGDRLRLSGVRLSAFVIFSALVAWSTTAVSVVPPESSGVLLRFGGVVGDELAPGLHVHWPAPVDRVELIQRDAVRRVEVGFRVDTDLRATTSPMAWDTRHDVEGYRKLSDESLTLTGDENLVDVAVAVHWAPTDAVTHRFRVADMESVVRGIAESNIRLLMAEEKLDPLLANERRRVLNTLRERIQADVVLYELGIRVVAVHYHDLHPPLPVVRAFREVFSAQEDKVRLEDEAQAMRNEELPRARAEANRTRLEAEAESAERSAHAAGDADRFRAVAEAARAFPVVTGVRMQLEAAEGALTGREKVIADPRVYRGELRRWLFAPRGWLEGAQTGTKKGWPSKRPTRSGKKGDRP